MLLRKKQEEAILKFRQSCLNGLIDIESVETCLCGSSNLVPVSDVDRYCLPFPTAVCSYCGLISQTRRIASQSQSLFYEEYYWDIVRSKSSAHTPEADLSDYMDLASRMSDRTSVSILEVGCGSGSRIITLVDNLDALGIAYTACATDFIDESDELKSYPSIHYIKGATIPETYDHFDIVIASHLIEHLTNPEEFLISLRTRLKPNGFIYIEVPGVHHIMHKNAYEYSYDIFVNLAHNFNFTLATLSNLLASAGYNFVNGTEEIKALYSPSIQNDTKPQYSRSEYLNVLRSIALSREKSSLLRSSLSFKLKTVLKRFLYAIQ